MIYGYARIFADGRSLTAQVVAFTPVGASKEFRETTSGAKTERAQLRRVLNEFAAGGVLTVTWLARSTRDLLNALTTIADRKAGFLSLGDTWADTITAHGRVMLTVRGCLAAFGRELMRSHNRGARPGRNTWSEIRTQTEANTTPEERGNRPQGER